MAKGTWSDTNKPIRPGFYNRMKAAALARIAMGKRGIVAMPVKADWGPTDQIVRITSEQSLLDNFGTPARSIEDQSEAYRLGRLALLGQPKELLLYRMVDDKAAKGKVELKDTAGATVFTVSTKYPTSRDFNITVEPNVVDEGNFIIKLYEGTRVIFNFSIGGTAEEAAREINQNLNNRFVDVLPGAGNLETLAAVNNEKLVGGNDGNETIAVEHYIKAMTAFETVDISGFTPLTDDEAIQTTVIGWATRLNNQGEHFRVYLGTAPNKSASEANIKARQINNDLIMLTGQSHTLPGGEVFKPYEYAAYLMAAGEGIDLRESLTNFNTPFVDVEPTLTHEEIEEALLAGVVTSRIEDGAVIIEDDVNTYKRFNEGHNEIWGNLRAIRFMHMVDEDTANTGNRQYVGKVLNDEVGQLAVLSGLKIYFETLELGQIIKPGWTVAIDEDRQKNALSDEFYWIWDADYINVMKRIFGTGVIR